MNNFIFLLDYGFYVGLVVIIMFSYLFPFLISKLVINFFPENKEYVHEDINTKYRKRRRLKRKLKLEKLKNIISETP